ncbi:DUF7667 family protein [Paenibacillus arenilitoris]|uniref:Uncharacterized protein n=1 Tax=Paenibacillus arenilitoris TaxID=2772299 RepID=A0A927H4W2_9BACL|nr:hypothetical protein [Paenibacillus arenilitoris]MBD2868295.1 hypothetical protein [Paenibacillus arenilitoris]
MVGIHPVHRRMAELTFKAKEIGGYQRLPHHERLELDHCMAVNADLILKLDSLKTLAFLAHEAGDAEWQQQICARIESLETLLL